MFKFETNNQDMFNRIINTCFAIICMASNLQSQSLIWSESFIARTHDLTLGKNQNVLTSGAITAGIDFDPGPGVKRVPFGGYEDIFISSLESSGKYDWAIGLGVTEYQAGKGITTDAQGNIYSTGYFYEKMDFDPGPGTFFMEPFGGYHDRDCYVIKLSPEGKFIWAIQLEGKSNSSGNSIEVVKDKIYITGRFLGEIDFDPASGTKYQMNEIDNSYTTFVLQLDTSSKFQWVKTLGGGLLQEFDLKVDNKENTVITGTFQGSIDLDPSASNKRFTSNGAQDLFILSLDKKGNYNWAYTAGGAGNDQGYSIDFDHNSSIYLSGQFEGTINFSIKNSIKTLSSNGSADAFVIKLNSDGVGQWIAQIGGKGFDRATGVTLNHSNQLHVVGVFEDLCDFDPGSGKQFKHSGSTSKGFLLTLHTTGKYRAVNTALNGLGSPLPYIKKTVVVDASNHIYVSEGYTSYSYVHKFAPLPSCSPSYGSRSESSCYVVPAFSGNQLWDTSGTYTDTLSNSVGCDSIVTVNLNLNLLDTSIRVSGSQFTSNNKKGSYQWIECSNGFLPLAGDTLNSFTATANKSYAVIVSNGTCTDTSKCALYSTVGITEMESDQIVNIYPNPTSSFVRINFGVVNQSGSVKLFSSSGQLLQEQKFESKTEIGLDLDAPNGTYILQIQINDNSIIRKSVIKL